MNESFTTQSSSSGPSRSIPWARFADILGGAVWSGDDAPQTGLCHVSDGEAAPSQAVEDLFRQPYGLFDEAGEISLIEVLWLKWRLFANLVASLRVRTQHTALPVLSLSPESLRVNVPKVLDPLLPPRWQFAVSISTDDPVTPYVPDGCPAALSASLVRPPNVQHTVFLQPDIHWWPLGRVGTSTVLVRSLDIDRRAGQGDDAVTAMTQLHIASDALPARAFSPHDVFCVRFHARDGRLSRDVMVWGTITESAERGFVMTGTSEPMAHETWMQFQAAHLEVWNETAITVYRSFGQWCDLYSLGMVLLHLLLGHSVESSEQLTNRVPGVIPSLEHIMNRLKGHTIREMKQRLMSELRDHGISTDQKRLLHADADAQAGVRISEDIWSEAILLAIRLMTKVEGVSFYSHAAAQSVEGRVLMEHVMCAVQHVGTHVARELFGAPERNREIVAACRAIRCEWLEV